MWKILNIRSPNTGERLNNVDQLPIRTDDDSRFTFLSHIGTSVKLVDNGRMGLSGGKSNAFPITLNGMILVCKGLFCLGQFKVTASKRNFQCIGKIVVVIIKFQWKKS